MKGKEAKQAGGWYFVPLTICVPTGLQDALTNILEDDAQTGAGLFANETKTEKEDEALDGLLCVEAYNCKHSFTKYLATLKQYNVAGKDGAFLKKDFTLYLFTLLKHCANIINENTDSPQRCKNSLNDVITGLDKVTIWGLFFQILLLNGLCKTLESIDLNEGDNGFDEAQVLHDWLFLALLEKLTWFCNGFYGENDLKQLSPLCEYLCTTEAGKIVQDWIKQEYYPEAQQERPELPEKAPEQPQGKRGLGGRRVKPFESHLIGTQEEQRHTRERLHELIDGRRGKEVVLYIKAAVQCGKITKPNYTTIKKEFGDIGSQQNFDAYMSKSIFTEDELTGAKNSLIQKK